MTTGSTSRRRAAGSHWAVLLAGPVVGITYFLVLYLVAEATCAEELALLGTATLRTVILATAVGSLAVLGGYAWRAVRLERADARTDDSDLADDRRANRRFMVLVGLMLLVMFAAFTLFLAVPAASGALC